jgi:hypothetical protein
MFALVVLLILLSNYVAVSKISSNSKTVYFTVLTILALFTIILKVLG